MIRSRAFAFARLFIIMINVVHIGIHGTFLDHGMLDATLESFDAYVFNIAAWLNMRG